MNTAALDQVFSEGGYAPESAPAGAAVPAASPSRRLGGIRTARRASCGTAAADGWRSWAARLCLGLGLLAAAVLSWQALPGRGAPAAAPAAAAPAVAEEFVPPAQPAAPRGKPIEDIRVGERVLGTNPLLTDAARAAPDPDPATWRRLELRMAKPGGRRLDIVLLRPAAWAEAAGAREGGTVLLDLPQLGAAGPAEVLALGPCPPIAAGAGQVVTGTFRHEPDGGLVDVRVQGLAEPIGCTDNHPFWSEDRGAFVPAGGLRAGERLRVEGGGVRAVASVTPRPAERCVYNLEVNGQHVYEVTRDGILVHNICPLRAAMNEAKRLADIPTSQQPLRSWRIGPPEAPYPGALVRHPEPTHWGIIYEYEIPAEGGTVQYRYVVVHDADATHGGVGHVHIAQSKAGPSVRLNPGESYLNLDDRFLKGDPIPFDKRR